MKRISLLVVALVIGVFINPMGKASSSSKSVPTVSRTSLQYMDVQDRILDLMQFGSNRDPRDVYLCRERIQRALANMFPEIPARCCIVVYQTSEHQMLMDYPSMNFRREHLRSKR